MVDKIRSGLPKVKSEVGGYGFGLYFSENEVGGYGFGLEAGSV